MSFPIELSRFKLIPDIHSVIASGDFDLTVGVHESTLNAAIEAAYNSAYPELLKGSMYSQELNIDIFWDVIRPPSLKIEKSGEAMDALVSMFKGFDTKKHISENYPQLSMEASSMQIDIGDYLRDSQITLALTVKDVQARLQTRDNPPKSIGGSCDCNVSCYVRLENDRRIIIEPFAAKAENIKIYLAPSEGNTVDSAGQEYAYDSFLKFIINEVIAPLLLRETKKIIPVIELPKPEYMGRELVDIGIDFSKDRYLVGMTNIKTVPRITEKNTEATAEKMPGGDFYVIASKKFLVNAATIAVSLFKGISGERSVWFGKLLYDLAFSSSEIGKISQDDITIGCNIDVNRLIAYIDLQLFKIGVSVSAKTTKKPFITCNIKVDNKSRLYLRTKSISDFSMDFHVNGIENDFINAVVNFLKSILVDILYEFILEGKDVPLLDIPILCIPVIDDICSVNVMLHDVEMKSSDQNHLHISGELRFPKSKLKGGESIVPGDFLVSRKNKCLLSYQHDGELVIYKDLVSPENIIWRSFTKGQASSKAVMREDGNFVVLSPQGSIVWQTWSGGNSNSILELSDGGDLFIMDNKKIKTWVSRRYYPDKLYFSVCPYLFPGQYIESNYHYDDDRKLYFVCRPDGRVEVLDKNLKCIRSLLTKDEVEKAAGGRVALREPEPGIFYLVVESKKGDILFKRPGRVDNKDKGKESSFALNEDGWRRFDLRVLQYGPFVNWHVIWTTDDD